MSKIMGGVAVVWCKVLIERERERERAFMCCIYGYFPFLSFPLDAGGK